MKETPLTEQQKAACRDQVAKHAQICARAEAELPGIARDGGRINLMMDLASLPELDLQKLLDAPKSDFAHDICGIIRHMDRSQYPGKLTDCFLPRCWKTQPATA